MLVPGSPGPRNVEGPRPPSHPPPRRERAARLDIRGQRPPLPPHTAQGSPFGTLQGHLSRSRARAHPRLPAGALGGPRKWTWPQRSRRGGLTALESAAAALWPLPLPETPIFGLGTASRCPVAERFLRRPLGPLITDSGCSTQNCQPSSRLEILAQPPAEGAGLPGWAPKVVWAGAGNSTEREHLGLGSRSGAGRGAGGRTHPAC